MRQKQLAVQRPDTTLFSSFDRDARARAYFEKKEECSCGVRTGPRHANPIVTRN